MRATAPYGAQPRWWRWRAAVLACALTSASSVLASCGLPDEQRTQAVDDGSVPYELLGPGASPADAPDEEPSVPRTAPVVFWLRPDDVLTPAATGLSCDEAPADVVRDVLDMLAASPSTAERDTGLASAIPPTATLTLVRIQDGVAEVDLDPVAIGDAERLPLAVGQVVLSVTSAPGVDAVRLVTSDHPVDLPLPSGALATGAATAEDYAALLPERPPDISETGEIGCPAPPA